MFSVWATYLPHGYGKPRAAGITVHGNLRWQNQCGTSGEKCILNDKGFITTATHDIKMHSDEAISAVEKFSLPRYLSVACNPTRGAETSPPMPVQVE